MNQPAEFSMRVFLLLLSLVLLTTLPAWGADKTPKDNPGNSNKPPAEEAAAPDPGTGDSTPTPEETPESLPSEEPEEPAADKLAMTAEAMGMDTILPGGEAAAGSSQSTPFEAAADVGSGGSFSYTCPINIPPGANGIQPNLSLVYNSAGGNGMVGMGWSIGGLSVITRDPSYPVNFDADDHYTYNGQKLVWVPAGTPGVVNDGYFHTENESFVRISACQSNGINIDPESGSYTIAYWRVELKTG